MPAKRQARQRPARAQPASQCRDRGSGTCAGRKAGASAARPHHPLPATPPLTGPQKPSGSVDLALLHLLPLQQSADVAQPNLESATHCRRGALPVEISGALGWTALHCASQAGESVAQWRVAPGVPPQLQPTVEERSPRSAPAGTGRWLRWSPQTRTCCCRSSARCWRTQTSAPPRTAACHGGSRAGGQAGGTSLQGRHGRHLAVPAAAAPGPEHAGWPCSWRMHADAAPLARRQPSPCAGCKARPHGRTAKRFTVWQVPTGASAASF